MTIESRTNNALKNAFITTLCHIIYLISSFICRTIFTIQLGAEYLGISGLFTNILTILSFAELGIGSTLVYRLYRPFADKDYNKINLYLNLYKKIYRVIIIIIASLGILIMPFLKYLVEAPSVKESLVLLYILYLSHTVASYFFVYKKTLLTANQKDYVVSIFTQISNMLMNIFQCVTLIIFKNFILYVIISIISVLFNNIICSKYVDKKYNFLKEKPTGKLDKDEIDNLKKDTKGLIMTKIASTAFSGTDNIFISAFIGIKYVGILSNYTLILQTINSFMNKIFSSITASIGNLAVSDTKHNKTESILLKIFFLNASMYSYICIGLIVLLQEFVTKIWLNNDYVLSNVIILFAIIELYLRSIHYPLYTTKNALGLFSQHKVIFVIAAILNIILDFILVKPLGICGLIIATIICRTITYITDIYVLYKFGFNKSSSGYYKTILKWGVFFTICLVLSNVIIKLVKYNGLVFFIVKGIIITILYFIMFILFFGKSEDLKYYKNILLSKLNRIK